MMEYSYFSKSEYLGMLVTLTLGGVYYTDDIPSSPVLHQKELNKDIILSQLLFLQIITNK